MVYVAMGKITTILLEGTKHLLVLVSRPGVELYTGW
jgi:hypothetical protein